MKKCDLATPAARIRQALENLEVTWQNSTDAWSDPVSQRFAEKQLEPMIPKIKIALDAIGRMHQLLTEVQRDCEQ
ncbi:MAG: hypothetical protein AB7G28_11950 [Pirellulales bacterium]|jgi:hypothetical protein